jgi:type IV pilus assembly protein PilM
MLGLAKSKGLVGLDVGSSSVKAVELGRRGNKYEVLSLALEEFAPGSMADGAVADNQSVSTAIGKLFRENNIKTRNVATAVSGHSVIVKKIVVAGDTPDQLSDAIAEEAARTIQLDLSEVT